MSLGLWILRSPARMKLIDALGIAHQCAEAAGEPYEAWLACSFSPLHFETFLTAHLSLLLPGRPVRVRHGAYGDLAVNLERAAGKGAAASVVALEWFDLDPRLGVRALGGWDSARRAEIVANARESAGRLKAILSRLASAAVTVLSPPSLPLPPAFLAPAAQLDAEEAQLLEVAAGMAAWAAGQPGLRVVHEAALSQVSPASARWDVKSDLSTGFPYTNAHADALAAHCARLLLPPAPLKGIITDLDDTLWRGIAGEDGPAGVAWTLEHGAQLHGLYQQALAALAEAGVLIGAASKNDARVAEEALRRPDLMLSRDRIFPLEANWGMKSASVANILRAWNVGVDSVVFIDDSPMEVDEVKTVFPQMECLRFPKENPAALVALLGLLRDRFGRVAVSEEDLIRRRSLEDGRRFEQESATSGDRESFLARLEAVLTFDHGAGRRDARALELVNKTNQFNLNGERVTEADWRARGSRPGNFVVSAAYQDRFGPLGKIAVLSGVCDGERVLVEDWVLSCRAFSRRIEHHCLKFLFASLGASEIHLRYRPTERNGPLRDCLHELAGELPDRPAETLRLTKEQFERRCPPLYHELREATNG